MQTGVITALGLATAGAGGRTLALTPGSPLAARVLAQPGADGLGLISLAGTRLAARLPHGVREGQELRLTVTSVRDGTLEARIEHDAPPAPPPQADPRAVATTGGVLLWLPGGRAAQVTVDPDGGDDAATRPGSSGEASFTLHCPLAGAIEVRLTMAAGAVAATVVAPPAISEAAAGAAADLVERLAAATGQPATATVRPRPSTTPPPAPPTGLLDVSV